MKLEDKASKCCHSAEGSVLFCKHLLLSGIAMASVLLLLTVRVTLGKSTSYHETNNIMHVRIKKIAGKTSSSIQTQWTCLTYIFRGLKYSYCFGTRI